MSSGCGDVLSLDDLKIAKLHQLFEAEVITGLQGGVSGGTSIDYATNQVTGQVQKTLPAVLRDAGFQPASITFQTGGTLSINDRNKVVFDSVTMAWYSWSGALPKTFAAATNPLSDPLWVPQTDPNLRSELASSAANKGASLVGTLSGQTVQQRLDSGDANTNAFKSATGFNLVGRFLNLAALKLSIPASAGVIVFCASSASSSATEQHYGGGYFESFDNSSSPLTDDGGVIIVPATGTLAWKRINFTDLELVFWGIKPDTGLDYSAQILKAMTYVRAKKATIKFPRGTVTSNETLPIWSNSSIIGEGREVSQFVKLTNNPFTVSTGVTVDALCACLPDTYNPAGFTMDTFCVRPQIKGLSLRRSAVTLANSSAYGIWGHKLASAKFSDMLVLGARYGFYGINCFLMIQEQVSYSGAAGSYAGVYIANTLSGSYGRSGTTCLFTQVGVGGYNFGFFIAGLDSTKLIQCDAEALTRASGETRAVAYNWINPMNCMMDCCYTENVDGVMLAATSTAPVSIINSLVVNCLNITPGNTFTQSTPLMDIESGGVGALNVTFIGGDLRNAAIGVGNMAPPIAAGTACVVKLLGAVSNPWNASSGATVTSL